MPRDGAVPIAFSISEPGWQAKAHLPSMRSLLRCSGAVHLQTESKKTAAVTPALLESSVTDRKPVDRDKTARHGASRIRSSVQAIRMDPNSLQPRNPRCSVVHPPTQASRVATTLQ